MYSRNFLRLGNPLCCSLNSIKLPEISLDPQQDSVQSDALNFESKLPTIQSSYTHANKSYPNSYSSERSEQESSLPSLEESQKPLIESNNHSTAVAKPVVEEAPFGGSLSLARIQSLVSMTTPRDGGQPGVIGQAPPFVEFDLSIDGFGCLFLPSIFPQNIDQV